jgi:hypothetical protein
MTARRSLLRFATVLLLPILLAACATTGKSLPEMQSSLTPPPSGYGRIFIYRTAVVGMALQPSIKVNDTVVGSAVPRGFFYVDRPAGEYRISSSTEVTRTLSLVLSSGQVRYVRMGISFGFFAGHVYPELVDESEGMADLANCHYVSDSTS